MQLLIEILTVVLPVTYAASVALYGWVFFSDPGPARRWAGRVLAAGLALHAVYILALNLSLGPHPISNRSEAFGAVAFAIAFVYLLVQRWQGSPGTGMFIVAPVFLFQLMASLFAGDAMTQPVREGSPLFVLHTGCAVIGYSAFALSAAHGLLYILLYRDLKRNRFGLIYERLPSLEVLTNMTVRAALVGFVFLTVAIALGITWSTRTGGAFWQDPMVLSTLLIWVLYALYVASYYLLGWRDIRTVYLSIAGFAVLVCSMVVVSLLYSSFHAFST